MIKCCSMNYVSIWSIFLDVVNIFHEWSNALSEADKNVSKNKTVKILSEHFLKSTDESYLWAMLMIFEMIRMCEVVTNILYVWHWAYQPRHATTAVSQTFCRLNVLAYIPRNLDNKVIFLRGSACKHSWTVTWALNVF